MSKFSKLLDVIKQLPDEAKLSKLDEIMDVSEDGIIRGLPDAGDADKASTLRRQIATKVNTERPIQVVSPRSETEFLPELSEDEKTNQYMNWLKERDPELADQKAKEMRESMEGTKVSAFAPVSGLSLNPVDNLKKGYEGFENARGKLTDYLAKQTTGYLPEASKDVAEKQSKQVMNVATDPLNYVGGIGAVDAGVAALDVLPEGSLKRFKNILGK